MAALRFSTSVLESQRTLGASNASNVSQDDVLGEESPKKPGLLRKSPRHGKSGSCGSPHIEGKAGSDQAKQPPLDKENQPRSEGPPKRSPSAGAFWTTMREADQLRQRLAQEEKLRLQAEAQLEESRASKRSRADAQAREIEELRSECSELEALRREVRQAKAKPPSKTAEAYAQTGAALQDQTPEKAEAEAPVLIPNVLGGLQKGVEDMEAQLGQLGRQTARNEANLKKLRARYHRSKSRADNPEVNGGISSAAASPRDIRNQLLAMRLVHNAVVSTLLSRSEEGWLADESKTRLHAVEASCDLADPPAFEEDALKRQLGDLKIHWAKAEAQCAEIQSSLSRQDHLSCHREELDTRLAVAEQRCKEMQSVLSGAEARLNEMQSTSVVEGELAGHRDELKTRLAAAGQRCREMQAALTSAEERFATVRLSPAEDALKHQLGELKIQWAATEDRCEKMQSSLAEQEELRNQRDCLKAQLAAADAQCAGMSIGQEALRSTCQRLQAQLEQAKNDESQVRAELDDVKRERDDAKVDLAAARARHDALMASSQGEAPQAQPDDGSDHLLVLAELDEVKRQRDELKIQLAVAQSCRQASEAPNEKEHSQQHVEELEPQSPAVCQEEDLLSQNNQLVLSLQLLKQDCELLEAENRSLKESAMMFEQNYDRVAGQHARLMGHANHKQKIHHTLRLKEENLQLRSDLTKTRKRVLQLQASRRGESLVDALAPLSAAVRPFDAPEPRACTPKNGDHSCTPKNAPQRSCTPKNGDKLASGTRAPHVKRSASGASVGQSPSGGDLDPFFAACATGNNGVSRSHCCSHERTLERISVDFRHFTALIERAVAAADLGTEAGEADADLAMLLQRLRGAVVRSTPGDREVADELGC